MSLGPQKISLPEIWVNAIWALISWVAWWIIILIIMFVLWDIINLEWNMTNRWIGQSWSPLFPILLSIVTLIWTSLSVFMTTKILSATSAWRYKNNFVTYAQLGFFIVFLYILITPVYIWTGLLDYNNIMIVFLIHVLLLKFGMSIILETMNNYRYAMIGLYGSFFGLIVSAMLTALIFSSFSDWVAKLIMLIVLMPIINFTLMTCKQLFAMAYYSYYNYSGMDPLWDVFRRIEEEEEEQLKEEEQKNMI